LIPETSFFIFFRTKLALSPPKSLAKKFSFPFLTATARLRVALEDLLRGRATTLQPLRDQQAGPRHDDGREGDGAEGGVDVPGLGLGDRRRDREGEVGGGESGRRGEGRGGADCGGAARSGGGAPGRGEGRLW
jgi:hypothetical protein